MRRILVFLCLVSTAAVGAWALPAGHAESTLDAASADAVEAPELPAEPQLDAPTAARNVAPIEAAVVEPDAAAPVEADPDAVPPHLDASSDIAAPAPVQIVTTTTAPPTTLPPMTIAPQVTVAFTASQACGSCDEPIPYDIFSGATTPGTTVSISSAYGSGSTTADGSGHWERKVEFPSAPRGETFNVTVNGLGGSKSFTFTATGGAQH